MSTSGAQEPRRSGWTAVVWLPLLLALASLLPLRPVDHWMAHGVERIEQMRHPPLRDLVSQAPVVALRLPDASAAPTAGVSPEGCLVPALAALELPRLGIVGPDLGGWDLDGVLEPQGLPAALHLEHGRVVRDAEGLAATAAARLWSAHGEGPLDPSEGLLGFVRHPEMVIYSLLPQQLFAPGAFLSQVPVASAAPELQGEQATASCPPLHPPLVGLLRSSFVLLGLVSEGTAQAGHLGRAWPLNSLGPLPALYGYEGGVSQLELQALLLAQKLRPELGWRGSASPLWLCIGFALLALAGGWVRRSGRRWTALVLLGLPLVVWVVLLFDRIMVYGARPFLLGLSLAVLVARWPPSARARPIES